jgi:hypothetical protein
MNADEEGKREAFVEIFFSEEGLRCVGTRQCLLAHWDEVDSRCRL